MKANCPTTITKTTETDAGVMFHQFQITVTTRTAVLVIHNARTTGHPNLTVPAHPSRVHLKKRA